MLETGSELAVQALVVGPLLRCTEKPRGSLKWARFYPEDAGDPIQFSPQGQLQRDGQEAGVSSFSREPGKLREGSGGIMCPSGTFCPLQCDVCISQKHRPPLWQQASEQL